MPVAGIDAALFITCMTGFVATCCEGMGLKVLFLHGYSLCNHFYNIL